MGDKSKIEWTEATWNPLVGCTRVSEGCRNCYAERDIARRLKGTPKYAGAAELVHGEPRWSGDVRLFEPHLDQPLRWKRGRRIFVCSMADLFHDKISNETIAAIFGVMAAAPQHTFQVLTKRAWRLPEWFQWAERHPHGDGSGDVGGPFAALGKALAETPAPLRGLDDEGDEGTALSRALDRAWPLPNVWLGVSVEDQTTAERRIPHLLKTPAAVRWISAEPLLGPLDLGGCLQVAWQHPMKPAGVISHVGPAVDWIVAGGESGPQARPMHPDWARSLRDQCAADAVPFLFKQWGNWLPSDGSGGEPPSTAKARLWTHGAYVNVGKKSAGRTLDGVIHDGYPEPR